MLTSQDRELLAQKGITEEQLNRQLADLKHGFPFLELEAAASVDNGGIFAPTETERNLYLAAWERYLADPDHEVVKFVPASGAASRMFKDLLGRTRCRTRETSRSRQRRFGGSRRTQKGRSRPALARRTQLWPSAQGLAPIPPLPHRRAHPL